MGQGAARAAFHRPTVVIPTYNESGNLERIVAAILGLSGGFHILIVDDASPDGTGALADRLAAEHRTVSVLHRTGKQGLGTAYLEGFRRALADGADVIFEMDADFSHDPLTLPAFLEAAQRCDVVIGSRYLRGVSVVNWPLRRLALSLIASLYVRVILDLPVKDSTSGFKCYRREVLEALDLSTIRSNGYAFQIEMKYRAHRAGFRLCEIPIIFVDRSVGATKMSMSIAWEALWMVWRLKFGSWFGRDRR